MPQFVYSGLQIAVYGLSELLGEGRDQPIRVGVLPGSDCRRTLVPFRLVSHWQASVSEGFF